MRLILDSNVPFELNNYGWLGHIPIDWNAKKLKYIFEEKKSTKNPLLNSGSISFGEVIYKNDEKITESTKNSYQEVLNGEFLINPLNLNFDLKSLRIALSKIDVVVSQGYIVLKINKEFCPNYYKYLLRKFDIEHMKSLGQGVRQTISFNDIKNEYLVIPPLSEQKIISKFLDTKTHKIDSLIRKIEKKIELLKEYKSTLINQCVTEGLNQNVEMKDSKVNWIGQIPIDWNAKKLKYIFEEKKSTKNPLLNSGSISFGEVIYKNDEKITESTKNSYQEVLNGEFLINPLNLNFDLKSLRIALSKIDVVVSQGYIVLKINKEFCPNYYKYLLRKFDIEHMKSLGQGVRQTISFNDIKNEYLVIPPLSEQKIISKFLDTKTHKIDSLIRKIEKRINLLKEYRQSLICSVVTGKVRITEEMS